MGSKTSRKKRRRLSPLGQLCAFLLVVLLIIFSVARCAAKRRADKYDYTSGQSTASVSKAVSSNGAANFAKAFAANYAKTTDSTEKLKISSKYGILINIDKNTVVAQKNSDTVMYPASLTKIMTLLVAVENIKDLNARYTFTSKLIDPLVADEASRAGFEPGESVTLNDILYGAILPSGADATSAIADYVSGSEAEFVELMNERAKKIGLKHTHFTNASGLHNKKHYTTVHEMALILKETMKNETCAKILSIYTYVTEKNSYHPDGIELYSTMFSRMYGNEAVGVTIMAGKTGYTTEGGNCLASYAKNDKGEHYILVTACAAGQYKPIYDAINVYAKYLGNGKTTLTEDAMS